MIVLKTTQDTVLAALQSVAGIVERRHTLPILANVLIRKTGPQVQLTTDIGGRDQFRRTRLQGEDLVRAQRKRQLRLSKRVGAGGTATQVRVRHDA